MAGRILNRKELRVPDDQAAKSDEAPATPKRSRQAAGTKTAKKTAAVAKPRKPRAKKAPARLRARWGIFDASMKQVAVFDYNQHSEAEAKLADLRAKRKSMHYMQIVKEPMPEPVEPAPSATA